MTYTVLSIGQLNCFLMFIWWHLWWYTVWEECSPFDYYIIWQPRKSVPCLIMTSYNSIGRVPYLIITSYNSLGGVFPIQLLQHMADCLGRVFSIWLFDITRHPAGIQTFLHFLMQNKHLQMYHSGLLNFLLRQMSAGIRTCDANSLAGGGFNLTFVGLFNSRRRSHMLSFLWLAY